MTTSVSQAIVGEAIQQGSLNKRFLNFLLSNSCPHEQAGDVCEFLLDVCCVKVSVIATKRQHPAGTVWDVHEFKVVPFSPMG